jgi:16S rRNA (cytosine1402-N4)-methyltransferase
VLAAEVVELLAPRASGIYVDGTVGLGGHTAALLAAGAGRVIGLDRDPGALAIARARVGVTGPRVEFVHADYRALRDVLAARGIEAIDGVVLDLGVSSWQIDEPARGFSFREAGPLDMRMDPSSGPSLREALATVDERTLADVIWRFGEERRSRAVARAILRARDRGALIDTAALASVVRGAVAARTWQRIDPATRTFQALRIWVNRELEGLDDALVAAAGILRARGRLAVIAFHSLEDRVVKTTFRRLADDPAARARLITRRPIVPGEAERARNARARSARLRALEKVEAA